MADNRNTVIDNRKVLKNTLFLYLRMLFVMVISIYTVRIVLKELGVLDYGVNNVVSTVVALCSFLTSSLTAVCNRFFSKEIVKGNEQSFNRCFCLNITTFSILAVIAVILLETLGVWYLNNKMIIPNDRMYAAHVVYQLSIVSLCISFISIPYNSLIISHERMGYFAYVGIFEAVAKLGVAYALIVSGGDKLIIYNILSLLVTVAVCGAYVGYCRRKFPESGYSIYWNYKEFKEIFSFVSWYFFGSISSVLKSSGINLIINAFFAPSVNAARAIAFQVESAIHRFSDGFFTASKPQIYKAYSNDEHEGLNKLIIRTSLLCTFLMAFLSLPVFFNAETILSVWLVEVPEKSVVFLKLIIIDSIINMISEPIILTVLATGRQKTYQVVEFFLRVITLPLAYIFLSYGYEPEITMIISIVFSVLSVYVRAFMLYMKYSEFKIAFFSKYVTKLLLAYTCVILIVMQIDNIEMNGLLYFLVSCVLSSLLNMVMLWLLIGQEDRLLVREKIIGFVRAHLKR